LFIDDIRMGLSKGLHQRNPDIYQYGGCRKRCPMEEQVTEGEE
jgi:hypothetical protein